MEIARPHTSTYLWHSLFFSLASPFSGTRASSPSPGVAKSNCVVVSEETLCVYSLLEICVFYYCRTQYKAVRVCGGEDSGGHVLREMMSRGLCGLVCPSHTSEHGG